MTLLESCKSLVPNIHFEEAPSFYWSPKKSTIYFNKPGLAREDGKWALVHEVAHALLNHKSYQTDAGLLMMEVEAWQKAHSIGRKLKLEIDEDHVQESLNTYRDWLYARSTCPTCELNSLQVGETEYVCLNCSTQWFVSRSRFCRPYRMQGKDKKTPAEPSQTMFV